VWEYTDSLSLLFAGVCHFGFMVVIVYYLRSINVYFNPSDADAQRLSHTLIYGISALYPPLALFLAACYKLYDDRGVVSPFVSRVFRLFALAAVGLLVAVIYYYPWYIGAAIMAVVVFLALCTYALVAWVQGGYVLSYDVCLISLHTAIAHSYPFTPTLSFDVSQHMCILFRPLLKGVGISVLIVCLFCGIAVGIVYSSPFGGFTVSW
jgi:hypothetical protein